ncbi:nitroreductase family protein [Reichenbachiella carrageenanivorans]|uniref:Nitroreductase family protein n=1 Tax=Reichenbachiella carrageenanivorans TaxID=2979869 RepID=A0ABY6CX28_9BACT|nr:nitroreductase family protein [Reichenbachiella carrageenanivorans]UXX78452.1 nitroreductase family protein [Reichenbachiella carrageenanivorans]
MSFLTSIQNRYTTKVYNPTKKISTAQIKELKEILRMSPSSINSQPWKFTFVSDPDTKKELAKASYFNDQKVINSDTVVVFSRIDNIDKFEQQIEQTLPEGAVGYFKQVIKPQPETMIKEWFDKQVYLALGVFLSACAEMGIDSTPMEGIEADKYNQILHGGDYNTLVAVAIGYRDQNDSNQVNITPKSRRPVLEVTQSI